MQQAIGKALIPALMAAGAPPAMALPASVAIFECSELQTCDAEMKCVEQGTRLFLAEYQNANGKGPYLSIGPLAEGAGGGVFYEQDWRWFVGGLPRPDGDRGRLYALTLGTDGFMSAHVYRPGKEVRGLKRSDWVRADYSCKQVLF